MTNTAKAVLSYVFGFISGIIFLAVEKDNEFVRKCAAQSFVFSLLWGVVTTVLRWVPIIGWLFSSLAGLACFGVWILLIVKASGNTYFRLPGVSELSERYVIDWFR
ncbi:MAG: DUF4870 domain-containing protein [Clostridiales bacterium]|jgi:uncharacterized membrane protein|nr:DUF4870 domain-containing protein [Clostridiales bacterium]